MPSSASNGVTANVQYNYRFSDNVLFYIYSGYSSWEKFNVIFHEDLSEVQDQANFKTYTQDEHKLIPVYIGSRINFNNNKFFTSFVTLEAGYSHLSYNSYGVEKVINPGTGEITAYTTDRSTKTEVTENLLGIGAGIGLSHQLADNINILLAFKLNSHLNSGYYDFLSSKSTYTSLRLGLNVGI